MKAVSLSMRIHQLIEELRYLQDKPLHTSVMMIYNTLENNKNLFLQYVDTQDFQHVLRTYEQLSHTMPKDFDSTGYKREYEQAHNILSFHLNRIL